MQFNGGIHTCIRCAGKNAFVLLAPRTNAQRMCERPPILLREIVACDKPDM